MNSRRPTRTPLPGPAGRERGTSGPLALALAAALALPTGLALADATPQDALQYTDPAAADARYTIEQRQEDLTFVRQMDANANVQPSFGFSDNLTNSDPAAFDAGVDVTTTIGYTYDYRGIIRDRIGLLRAQADLAQTLRRGRENALRAQAGLLEAQVALHRAQVDVADASDNLNSVQDAYDNGDALETDLQNAKLNVQYQALSLDQAKQALADAQDEAAAYGLDTTALYVSVRFALPDADATSTSDYRRLQLNAELAQANMTRGTVFDAVQNLKLYGNYSTGDVNLFTQVGVDDRNPRAEIGVDYPGGKDRWAIGVSAEFKIGTDLLDVPRYQHAADAAQSDLAAYPDGFASREATARAQVDFAERSLTLVEQEYQLRTAEYQQAQEAFQKAKSVYDAATGNGELEAPKPVARDFSSAQSDLSRAQDRLLRTEASEYGNYMTYIRRVGDYLDIVEGSWALQ